MASIEVVSVNGFEGVESVNVHAAFNEAARSFSFVVAAELGASATNAIFAVGTQVTITTNGDLLLTGHVDAKEPKFDAFAATITVCGRSSSADLVDGSAEHETGQFENQDPLQIGQAISSQYGASWESDQQLDKIEQYQLTQGESCFRCIEKMAHAQGMTITGTAEGNAKITKAGSQRQGGSLVEGVNILSGTAHHNGSNRHSKIIVRGQRPFGHGDENLAIEAQEQDGAVQRHRTKIIVQDQDTTKDRAQKRATDRKNRAAGNALKASIEVQGFHDDGGQLWAPGNLVWTESPFLDIAQDMLIESVDYNQSDKGSIATLNLTDPRSYGGGGSAGSGNQSGAEWDQ
jgi:prophage tail gpP-like protein